MVWEHWNVIRHKVLVGLVIVTVFAACSPQPAVVESELYSREVVGEVFDTTPVRGEVRPLRHRRGSFEYKCSECHNDFTSPRRQNELQGEHADLAARFDHGMNTYCVNCHHQTDRNSYTAIDGSPISSTQPARLCAQCHGPTFRDWEQGIHGRQNGGWNRDNPARSKLLCIQCHDPHEPKFAPMKPDPPTSRTRFDTSDTHHQSEVPLESTGSAH